MSLKKLKNGNACRCKCKENYYEESKPYIN